MTSSQPAGPSGAAARMPTTGVRAAGADPRSGARPSDLSGAGSTHSSGAGPVDVSGATATDVPAVPAVPADPAAPVAARSRGRSLSRLLRIGFLVLVVLFAAYWVWRNRSEVGQAWQRVDVWAVLAAAALGAGGAWSGVPAWRDLLTGLGSRLRLRDAQRVFLMGQLGKYIPGGVWTVVAQASMARDLHVPRSRSATASLLSILVSVVTAGVLGAVGLLFGGSAVLGRYGWLLLFLVPLIVLLHPAVLVWVGRLAARVTGRAVALERMPARDLLGAAGWLAAGQVLIGAQFYVLVGSISGRWDQPLLDMGLCLLATAAGVVVVFAPAGAGPRELILGIGLSGVLDPGSVVLVVLLSRLVLTVVDVLLAAGAAALARRAGATAAEPA
ncbi:lysylphosphatidylglycerol synthase transmembrane domain-containing protein [Nakamurella endophytica]|uniref:Uncharacterized protein n=1 Tax=Nakamurella endophytica TaxID=1748367 RepID=A0A917SLQ4_9ACTN|nr:lysylphosphatidylglycerol synthase domain-containing protein [Nakamurella endophytica]GGL87053.1 hypothetical protein GCM10011594_03290 [Nakamurella endophytica]